MALTINITQITEQDYDGVNETIKEVNCDIDGVTLKEYYSYPTSTADTTINTEVEADLTAKGYTWI